MGALTANPYKKIHSTEWDGTALGPQASIIYPAGHKDRNRRLQLVTNARYSGALHLASSTILADRDSCRLPCLRVHSTSEIARTASASPVACNCDHVFLPSVWTLCAYLSQCRPDIAPLACHAHLWCTQSCRDGDQSMPCGQEGSSTVLSSLQSQWYASTLDPSQNEAQAVLAYR